ncbi:Trefoil factor 2 [Camelus dromedarius]|uniref:Trefoil factor 2 n=1 Tax=Camelus dromedarius TaxID=9838 RepID=A0A5N4EJ65_CAMDR|nr:Trefoil factor 2 [Camelus dromedarius]
MLFPNRRRAAELEECVMEVSARKDCGFPGISPENCTARECCFSDAIRDTLSTGPPLPVVLTHRPPFHFQTVIIKRQWLRKSPPGSLQALQQEDAHRPAASGHSQKCGFEEGRTALSASVNAPKAIPRKDPLRAQDAHVAVSGLWCPLLATLGTDALPPPAAEICLLTEGNLLMSKDWPR